MGKRRKNRLDYSSLWSQVEFEVAWADQKVFLTQVPPLCPDSLAVTLLTQRCEGDWYRRWASGVEQTPSHSVLSALHISQGEQAVRWGQPASCACDAQNVLSFLGFSNSASCREGCAECGAKLQASFRPGCPVCASDWLKGNTVEFSKGL